MDRVTTHTDRGVRHVDKCVADAVRETVRERGQAVAAALFGVSRPTIMRIVAGREIRKGSAYLAEQTARAKCLVRRSPSSPPQDAA